MYTNRKQLNLKSSQVHKRGI